MVDDFLNIVLRVQLANDDLIPVLDVLSRSGESVDVDLVVCLERKLGQGIVAAVREETYGDVDGGNVLVVLASDDVDAGVRNHIRSLSPFQLPDGLRFVEQLLDCGEELDRADAVEDFLHENFDFRLYVENATDFERSRTLSA